MAVHRNKRRRRRRRLGALYAPLSLLLILAALAAGSLVFFRVNTITVTGNIRYTQEEILAAAQVETGNNLFRLNKAHMAEEISLTLPYIRDISIRRKLPDTLLIHVEESHAAAAIQGEDGWYLLDARGKLLEQGGEALCRQAPPITGLTPLSPAVGEGLRVAREDEARLEGLTGLLTALETQNVPPLLTAVDLTAANTISFSYGGRFTVTLPIRCDHAYKVRVFLYVMEQLEDNETGLIDLTRTDAHFIPQQGEV